MDSNITINIVEPGSSTPIEPVVPNTGLFTSGIGGPEATILGISAAVVILAAIIAVLYYRKKQGKFINLKHKKSTAIGLVSLAAVVSLGTAAGLLKLGASATDDSLTVTSSSEELTIELADEPVFAVLPVELTVTEATEAGYTLTAYADSTNLVSTTDSSNIIPMITLPQPLAPNEEGVGRGWGPVTKLTDNTYGLALAEPASQAEEVYTTLSTDADAPTFITDKDHKATEAGDTTTIYYGFYITPDVPYGTYTGSDIYYDAEVNYTTTLTFNGNDNDGGEEMESVIIPAGDSTTLPPNTYTRTGYEFVSWNTNEAGTGQAYTDGAEYTALEGEFAEVTLYAQWNKLPVIGDLNYMQDFATLSDAEKNSVLESMTQEVTYTLKDKRDEQEYTVAMLKDGNVWMTKNLNLAGGLTISSEFSDVPENYTLPVENGFQSGNRLPASSRSGFNDDTKAFLYNSNKTQCSSGNPCYSYYSWTTATVGSGLNVTEANADAPYSICPKGWRMPKSRVNLGGGDSIYELSDFYQLGVAYGMKESYSSFYVQAGPGTVPNFILSGAYRNGDLYFSGSNGTYLSATSRNDTGVLNLSLNSSYMGTSETTKRGDGVALRCLVR